MDEHPPQVSPELAQAQLRNATSARIGNNRDRWIHGIATIAFGLLWGGYLAYVVRADDLGPLDIVLVVASVLVAVGIHLWTERAGTAPRHSTRARGIGMWASFAVVLVLPLVPEPSVDQPWLDLLVAGLIAAPIVLAGLWILIRR